MGDTDRTPDGGFSAGFLHGGGQNLRKAAAYTYQALLDLAATTFGVDKSQLTVKDGVVSGGGKRMTYGELVRGQQLEAHDSGQRRADERSAGSPSPAIRR